MKTPIEVIQRRSDINRTRLEQLVLPFRIIGELVFLLVATMIYLGVIAADKVFNDT